MTYLLITLTIITILFIIVALCTVVYQMVGEDRHGFSYVDTLLSKQGVPNKKCSKDFGDVVDSFTNSLPEIYKNFNDTGGK